jgi:hypothetical protein
MPAAETITLDLRVGDVVEVRSQAEILETLDENGELDSLPFMPEMLQYCGQRLTVDKVAHKACDTLTRSGTRRMDNAVHLSAVRCDGSAHGGCQAACLIYWKHAWLRKVDPAVAAPVAPAAPEATRLVPLLTIASRRPPAEDGETRYRCQATEMLRATPQPLPVRDLGQYVEDVRSGNVGVLWSARALLVGFYNRLQDVSAKRLPPRLRLKSGRHWGSLRGTAVKTPTRQTGLQPGDIVRIKSKQEIEPTLNAELLNRGMGFDAEMARFCGRTARVARRVEHILDEHTGRMLHMRSPCLVLEGIVCEGAFSASCPRAITPYWREIWLERVAPAATPTAQDVGAAGVR